MYKIPFGYVSLNSNPTINNRNKSLDCSNSNCETNNNKSTSERTYKSKRSYVVPLLKNVFCLFA